MPDYDFHTLSPIDFENLSRDLIQREFGILLESFTSGKDQGIDFRGFLGEENCIIQCKHYTTMNLGLSIFNLPILNFFSLCFLSCY